MVQQWETPCNAGDAGGSGLILEEEMAVYSSILAWRSSWTEEPGGLQSMWSHRVGHDWALSISTYVYVWLNHFTVHWKLTQYCKSTMLVVWWFSHWVVSSWLTLTHTLGLIFPRLFILPQTSNRNTWVEPFFQFSSVQSLSHAWPFATPWARRARPCCPSPAPGA